MRTALRRVLAQEPRDRGLALPLVIGITGVLAALIVAAVAFSVGSLRKAGTDQDWNAALAAAYAGVEEYESRLANDTGYYAYGNPASEFTNPTHSPTSTVSLPTGAAANPAFGLGSAGTWANVPGSAGTAQFRYEVDNSKYYTDGTLRVRSTGRAGDSTRSIVADLKQQGFIDFLYFTDFEVGDPQASNPTSTTNCAIRYPNARPGCSTISFGSRDVIDGPLHTNDAIHTNGPAQFLGKTTTSWRATSGPNYVRSNNAPYFKFDGDPTYQASIGMPATNAQLKKETRSDLPAEVPVTGCLYTGPTSIEFKSNGTMTVISPWTKFTNTSGSNDTAGTNPSKCGAPGASGLAKKSGSAYVGVNIPVPANLVVYVQTVPGQSSNVNHTADTRKPAGDGAIPCASTTTNNIGYPIAAETPPFTGAYGCKNGDVFVRGTLSGRATLSAENYVYVTGDLKYNDAAADMLGLVGQNAVWVWNPMERVEDRRGNVTITPMLGSHRTIHAAILSVAHTFMVQNYDQASGNPRGTLTVVGAIAQKYRGPVGQSNSQTGVITSGYIKAYDYDDRFKNTAPPKFLSPVTTTYGINVWIEVQPAFDGDGNYR
jgi:Tfp pilus assembly protein PilX